MIHRGEGKWRRSEKDSCKDEPSDFKGKQTLGFPELQLLFCVSPLSTLYKIYMTHQKGHKSLFDFGTRPEKYISCHLFLPEKLGDKMKIHSVQFCTVSSWKFANNMVQTKAKKPEKIVRGRGNGDTVVHIQASPCASVKQWDVAPQCHLQLL